MGISIPQYWVKRLSNVHGHDIKFIGLKVFPTLLIKSNVILDKSSCLRAFILELREAIGKLFQIICIGCVVAHMKKIWIVIIFLDIFVKMPHEKCMVGVGIILLGPIVYASILVGDDACSRL